MESIISKICAQARQLGACELLTGRERTLAELVAVFLAPQGLEFCMAHRFPSLATLRLFGRNELRAYGIYLDCGKIELQNPKRAILIGRTHADISCNTTERHNIYLMHGASAILAASNWAVVRAETQAGCNLIKRVTDNAIIL